jgi:hypothetical protein
MNSKFEGLRLRCRRSRHFVAACALAAATILAGLVPAHAQTNISFPAPTTYLASDPGCTGFCPNTLAVATGDFNGDGKLDVINLGGDSSLNVLISNGNGTLQTPVYTPIAAGNVFPEAIAVGDFNGDKILDVAVWQINEISTSMQVNIYLGTGNGNFTTGATLTTTGSSTFNPGPSSIAVADVNGDGKLDIVALTPYNGVYVFLGNGDGTFKAAVAYATVSPNGGPAGAIAIGDLNGDGHPDLAITAATGFDAMLNSGSGTFGAATFYDAGHGGFNSGDGIAIGDVNGDSKLDVVVTTPGIGATVFQNQGSGTFAPGSSVTVASVGPTTNVALADINNDKKLDIVVPDSVGNVYTFLGKGTGAFTAGSAYSLEVYQGTSLIALGDFNVDGTLDLIQTSGFTTNTLSLGRGDGTFKTAQLYLYPGNVNGQNLVVADFNGDGFPDVASQGPTSGTIGVVLGSIHGALTAAPIYATASSCLNNQVYGVASGDVNGDGKVDMVATLLGATVAGCQNHTVAVMLGAGTGKFQAAKYYATGTTGQEYQVYLVDINGDGKLDIVTSNNDGTISVLLNKGNGTFNAPMLVTGMQSINAADNQLAFADFTGDGKIDIAVAPNPNVQDATGIYVMAGTGKGTFGTPILTSTGLFQLGLAAGDFNNDGKQDLIVTTDLHGCTAVGSQSGYVYLQGLGNGTFTPGTQVCNAYPSPVVPVVADFNADGKLDVVIPYSTRNTQYAGVTILQGAGNGTFTASPITYTGYGVVAAGVGDFNGDGMPDVVVADYLSYFSVLPNATQPVSLSPLNLAFRTAETVGSTVSSTVVLTNDQTKALAISSITLGGSDPGDFTETNTCGASRKSGWDCTITVKFTPAATGARSATLSIKDGAGTQVVQLSGTGK